MASEITHPVDDQPQSGQTMAEYTVVLGVITLAIVIALAALSGAAQAAIERAASLVERIA
jgi:Flp pilus assembly pilin Flp